MDREKIKSIVAPIVESYGAQVVSVMVHYIGRGYACRIDVDGKIEGPVPAPYKGSALTIGAIEKISREVSAALGASEGASGRFSLEVSTPGLDRPLVRPEDYDRFVGHRVKVVTKLPVGDRRKFQGRLVAVEREGEQGRAITLEACEPPEGAFRFSVVDIEEARLIPEFPEPGKKKGPVKK